MSNFAFLTTEWKDIHDAASKAESAAIPATVLAVVIFLPEDAELC